MTLSTNINTNINTNYMQVELRSFSCTARKPTDTFLCYHGDLCTVRESDGRLINVINDPDTKPFMLLIFEVNGVVMRIITDTEKYAYVSSISGGWYLDNCINRHSHSFDRPKPNPATHPVKWAVDEAIQMLGNTIIAKI